MGRASRLYSNQPLVLVGLLIEFILLFFQVALGP